MVVVAVVKVCIWTATRKGMVGSYGLNCKIGNTSGAARNRTVCVVGKKHKEGREDTERSLQARRLRRKLECDTVAMPLSCVRLGLWGDRNCMLVTNHGVKWILKFGVCCFSSFCCPFPCRLVALCGTSCWGSSFTAPLAMLEPYLWTT